MNIEKIESTSLTDFSALLKDMINNGVYFLYSVSIENKPEVKYLLSTDNVYYLLSETGLPLEKITDISSIKPNSRILFSDIINRINNNSVLSWAY